MYLEATTRHLNEYGEAGLRTLALAYRRLDEQEYSAWNNEFQKAKTAVGADREAMLEQVSEIMEKELILVGATAVEDKLQKGVGFMILYFIDNIHCCFLYFNSSSKFSFFLRCPNALINLPKLVSRSGC